MGFDDAQNAFPKLEDYNISPALGFLSSTRPLDCLPGHFQAWNDIAPRLSSLIAGKTLRSAVDSLPLLDTSQLQTAEELHRAFVILSFLVHAYIWQDGLEKPEANISATIAEPYLNVCGRLGVRETLSYAGLCLWNWRVKRDAGRGVESALDNLDELECYLNFTGTRDEEVFYLVPVMVEAAGGKLPAVLLEGMEAALLDGNRDKVVLTLEETTDALQRMGSLMKLLHQQCNPEIFYRQLRPFLPGAKGMEEQGMPDGVVFHRADGTVVGIKAVGGSAAQSSLFPFLDLALGVEHKPLAGAKGDTVFDEMRAYMPLEHRRFLDNVSKLPSLRRFVEDKSDDEGLVQAYNDCLERLASWRSKHIGVVTTHIVNPARKSKPALEPEDVKNGLGVKDESRLQGTGGSALIPFLKQARTDTIDACKR